MAIGSGALGDNTTGYCNVAVGVNALNLIAGGNYNTAIGYYSFKASSSSSDTNSTALGHAATVTASDQVRIGDALVKSIGGYADWTNLSDRRFKKDIRENVPGLDFILKLRPVTYHLDVTALNDFLQIPDSLRILKREKQKEAIVQTGFIAQEVEQAAQEVGFDFSGVDKPKNEHDHYGLRYAEFVVPLVKAVQEQQKTIERQNEKINRLEEMVRQQNKLIHTLLNKIE